MQHNCGDSVEVNLSDVIEREMLALRSDATPRGGLSALIRIALDVKGGALTHDNVERVNAYDRKS